MKKILPNNRAWQASILLISATLIGFFMTQMTLANDLSFKDKKLKVQQIRISSSQKFPDLEIIYIGKELGTNSTLKYGNCDSRIKIRIKNIGHSSKSSLKYYLKSGKLAKGSEQHLLLKIRKKYTLPSKTDLIDQNWSFIAGKTKNFIVKHKFPAAGKYSLSSTVFICLRSGTKCEVIPESNTKNNTKNVLIMVTEAC